MLIRQNQNSSLKKQQGVAAVWMGLLLVPIMGVTFWAVESSRYVQESSRLRDSAEAAAIAVTIEDRKGRADSMAEEYVRSYVRDIESTALTTSRDYRARDDAKGIREYIEYTVDARTTHKSWFVSNFIPSFDRKQELAGRSVAGKEPIQPGEETIDIVFVSDFSSSMWGSKIRALKSAIDQISIKILCESPRYDQQITSYVCDDKKAIGANRVGFVPFNIRTREITSSGDVRAVSQLVYKNGDDSVSTYTYNDINWNWWRTSSKESVVKCSQNYLNCNFPQSQNYQRARRVLDAIGTTAKPNDPGDPDQFKYIDFKGTVSDMFNEKSRSKSNFYSITDVNLYTGAGGTDTEFRNIRLTNDLLDLEAIQSMGVEGNTAAYQGILKGLQVLKQGQPTIDADEEVQQAYQNKNKMLLILSDGQETNERIINELVKNKMCDKAREDIPGLYIGVIGIKFSASDQNGFKECVENEDEDIIDVSNLNELIEKIEELIMKGSRGLGITRLYQR